MDDVINPDEALRAANPVDERDLIDAGDSPFAQALFQRATGVPYRRPARAARRRSPRVYVAALVAVLTTGVGIGYALIVHRAPRQLAVGCYTEPRLDAQVAEVAGSGDPVAACRDLWAHGLIQGRPPVVGLALSACVLPGGKATGVFPDPAGTVCRQLRLTPIDVPQTGAPLGTGTGTVTTTLDPLTVMRNTVVTGLTSHCLDAGQARLLVRAALDHAGLTAWKVTQAAPFSAGRPCASPGFDELNHQVLIVPIPVPPAGG